MLNIEDRRNSIAQAIIDDSIDKNTLLVIVDFHVEKGKLTAEDGEYLMGLLFPPEPEGEGAEE